jgi:hypothetical protein
LAAGIQKIVVAILKEERQIVVERAGDSVLTRKGPIKNLEAGLSGRCGGSARRGRRNAQRRGGETEGCKYCSGDFPGDPNRSRRHKISRRAF